jgi:hypothetical protein
MTGAMATYKNFRLIKILQKINQNNKPKNKRMNKHNNKDNQLNLKATRNLNHKKALKKVKMQISLQTMNYDCLDYLFYSEAFLEQN